MPQPFVILTWRSVWQTPLAARRTRISSSPRSSKAIGSTATLSPAAFSIAPRSLTTRGYAPVFIERSFGISSPPVARLVGRLSAPTLVRRRQRRTAARKKSITAAELRLFRKKGYHAASMQNIADAVGLYKGSLYYYVSSKEELLVRLFEGRADQVLGEIRAITYGTGTCTEQLRAMVRAYVLGVLRNLDSVRRSEEHTSELQSHSDLVCRLLLEKKKKIK